MLNWILDLYFIFSADKQQKKDSVKCDQSAGQEQDEYGGSTDEEPGDARETGASASLPPEASAEGPLDDSLKDITDVAPCRKRRFRHVPAPQPEVKRPQRPQKRSVAVPQLLSPFGSGARYQSCCGKTQLLAS
ncbi:hypothetical protein fugu_019086 [Takifugu bimaculatus]|uniref:XRCC4 C-terminal domain-containing protein n=1 Tax=Takifugu bimaculatus TaxID=433685 RepID=A0A4Z2BI84_9TELE|nr:hypothetical protein fugu_019086 [Takifugu bimaculatus]